MRIAILDKQGVLIDVRYGRASPGDVDAGDLPADGSYRWDGETFMPVTADPAAVRVQMMRCQLDSLRIASLLEEEE